MSEPRRTQFRIPAAHPCLAGHFPGNPVVPGVLVLDHVLQAAERELGHALEGVRLAQVKFLLPLLPEQVAEIELHPGGGRLRFRVCCQGELLASGELEPVA